MIWHLSNSTKYEAVATLAADRDGGDLWVTVIKATFDVSTDGVVERSQMQLPIVYAPLFSDDPVKSSLLAESDIDYTKPGVDVLVQGMVYAPKCKPVREAVVLLEVNDRKKLLRVHGERVWRKLAFGVVVSDAEPFTQLPLVYERAFGGFDPINNSEYDERNPAGCGFARKSTNLMDRPAPQIEYYDDPIDDQKSRPAGFGPIARHWLPRRYLAGTFDKSWMEERLPLLPKDFDERFFMSAPEDQQFSNLPPHALIRLVGMTLDGSMNFKIPHLVFGINIQLGNCEVYRRPVLRSVLILPDSRKVVMIYSDAMPCTGKKLNIIATEVVEKKFIR